MSSVKAVSQRSPKNSRRKTSGAMSADASPDSKCPICLDLFSNISYLDICLHKFCFQCIREWSKNKAECPLCKQPFNSIYHSIKSEQDFQKYDLRPSNNGSFGTFGGVRFRYRTTLTGVHRQVHGRTSVPQDTGVMFEAPTTSAQQHHDRYLRQMMMRLAARKKAAREGREATKIREQEMINFRRDLYRRGVKVRTVQDGGRSRDISAKFYQKNPACLHRLIPWLKRELLVLYGPDGSLVNMVQHIIMSKITRFNIDSEIFQEELRPFLQGRTDHFLHEFICFAKSPFNMETHDQHAVYDCPARPSEEDSSSNSSVIAISEDEEHSVELDRPGESMSTLSHSVSDNETPGPSYATSEVSRAGHLLLLESDSDSSLEGQEQEEEETKEFRNSLQQMEQHSQGDISQGGANSQECLSSDSDDCVIVGFVKPRSQRTPELVQLSSDSDSEENTEVPPAPSVLSLHLRLSSSSPQASQASSPGRERPPVEKDHYHQFNSKEGSSRYSTSKRSDRKDRYRRHDGSERLRKRHKSKDREHRRRRSNSRERRHSSRSPVTSQRSVTTLTRERSHSYSRAGDLTSDNDRCHRWRDSYQSYQSYRHYSHDSGKDYTEKQSYWCKERKYLDRHSSHSRSRSRSRDSQKHERRHSCSLSRSRSPPTRGRFHQDKPGGKRKYKTRHLDSASKDARSLSCLSVDSSRSAKHKKKSKEKHRRKSKERSRKSSRSRSEEERAGRECSSEHGKRHHRKKKKHKKKSKKHKSNDKCAEKSSLAVITIDSDSDSMTRVCVNQVSSTTNRDNPADDATHDPEDPAPPTPVSET